MTRILKTRIHAEKSQEMETQNPGSFWVSYYPVLSVLIRVFKIRVIRVQCL